MPKRGEGQRCACRVPFDDRGKAETCHCTTTTEDPSGVCHFCRGWSPFGVREPAHTSSGYAGRLKKLPQYSGKATD